MGVDKARLPLGARPMAEAVAAVLAAGGCGSVFLVRRGPPDGLPWSAEVVREDEALPRHVLSGFVTALDHVQGPVLVAACDLFELDPVQVERVLARPGAVALAEGAPGILAHLVPSDRAGLLAAVRAGGSFRRWVEGRPTVEVGMLRNANRWEDLGRQHPVEALVTRFGLRGSAAERVERGERARLAATGCLLP
ncbi:MAG: hypothetical protein EP330_25555 [Deltaproteobacteria bacterium]|nr:MAG: hypothetical protein EP330_25555 [Deltaproteobacteria bacterium]